MIAYYQPHVAALLREQLSGGTFSQVSLFGGDRYTLRMTSAIECARILSCSRGGDEECVCPSCTRFSTLSHSDLVIVSQRDHHRRMEAAMSAFLKDPNGPWRARLVRTIRIPLLAFHPILLEEASSTVRNAASRGEGLNNLLYELTREGAVEQKEAQEYVRSLRKALKELFSGLPKTTTVSIDQVRSIDGWVHQTNISGQLRFIILEGIEQTNVAARNALLKLLEEPPEGVYFFLISEHPSRIMPTILSRSRRYLFPPMSDEKRKRFIASYGPVESDYDSLHSFYLTQGGVDIASSADLVDRLLASLIGGRALDSRSIATLASEVEKTDSFEYVLTALGEALAKSGLPLRYVAKATSLIDETFATATVYNQNRQFTFEALYYRLLEER
ncbi:MAG: hypothetical protein GX911_07035 [Spirochaetales bacterium]|nr:hypothetical protein [Spirochaetales bacterium]